MDNFTVGTTIAKDDLTQEEYSNIRTWAKNNNCYISFENNMYTICEDIPSEEDIKATTEKAELEQAEKDAEFLEMLEKWGGM